MEKRVTFSSTTIGLLFVAPMLLLIFVFFYWPTTQALYWAFTLEQPWGGGNSWAGVDNFLAVFADNRYWTTVLRSGFYALVSTVLSMAAALILALFADRALKGTGLIKGV